MIRIFAAHSRLLAGVIPTGALVAVALLAAGASAQAAGYCSRASQCRGPLPQICERCSNGRTACAHWTCVAHRCVMQICGRVSRYR